VDDATYLLAAHEQDAAEVLLPVEAGDCVGDLARVEKQLLVAPSLVPLLRPAAFAHVVLDVALDALLRPGDGRRNQEDARLPVVRDDDGCVLVLVPQLRQRTDVGRGVNPDQVLHRRSKRGGLEVLRTA